MSASTVPIPAPPTLKISGIKLVPVEDSGKKFGPWQEEDFPFRKHPITIACPDRPIIYDLHVCVETTAALKNVFLEATVVKNRTVNHEKKKFSFERKLLELVKQEGDTYYHCQFWQWPGTGPGANYAFWRFADSYTLSGFVFKHYFDPQNSPTYDWIVNDNSTFTLDFL
jgi:hypothetical protein